MDIIVQKFGGTSVSTEERRKLIIEKVKRTIANGEFPVVVVSAMGRKGAPYATDTLINKVDCAMKNENKRAMDLLMSCGETISTVVMCSELLKAEVPSAPLTGGQAGIITDDKYMEADILEVEPDRISELIKEGIVPVIAGFQGRTKNWDVTTIGRGGSDVTAAVIGAAIKSKRVEIYSDVDGILTSDPNIVPEASLIRNISFEESFQFAYEGAKVIHPRAVEIARKNNLTLLIKNTMSDSEGTIIDNNKVVDSDRIITGIASKSGRIQVNVENVDNENYFAIFTKLAEEGISLDLINVFPNQKIFTIDQDKEADFKRVMSELGLEYGCRENCCKISLIGAGMRGTPGVMARILTALTREGVEVLQTADSHNTIWCLVNEGDRDRAIISLHREFELGI